MKRIISGLAAAVMLAAMLSGCGSESATDDTRKDPTDGFEQWESAGIGADSAVPGMESVLENDRYALYLDAETTNFAVRDKQTEQVMYAVPADMMPEEFEAGEDDENAAIAPISIDFYDRINKLDAYNSFDDCVAYGQQEYWVKDNTLRIVFVLGRNNEKDVLPQTLCVETYDAIMEALSSTDARAIKSNYMLLTTEEMTNGEADAYMDKSAYLEQYPGLKERDLYVMRDVNESKKNKIKKALEEYGFTYEDMVEERRLAGVEYVDDSVKFTVPLDITLDDTGFSASVDASLIDGTTGYRVKTLELFPAMTATDEDGDFFVPDGSGARIPMKAIDTVSYSQKLYGEDESRITTTAHTNENDAVLPFFAISAENHTVFADVTSGAAAAVVQVFPMGGFNNYAYADYVFTITDTDNREDNKDAATVESLIISKRSEQSVLSVHYRFSDKKESYAEIAVAYREALTARGLLQKNTGDDMPMLLDLYGLMRKKGSVMGITVNNKVPLTTFSQAQGILSQLHEGGVDAISVRYLGAVAGGLQNGPVNGLDFESKLGGRSGWKKLSDYAAKNGISLYPDAPISYVYNDGSFDGFSKSKDGDRLISGQSVSVAEVRPVDNKRTQTLVRYTVNADAIARYGQAVLRDIRKRTLTGISFSTLGRTLNSNFNRKNFSSRIDTEQVVTDLLRRMRETGAGIAVDTGHLYTLAYADAVFNLPSGNSGLSVEAESIPFTQIVLSGSVRYAMSAFNRTSDMQQERLRAIETGSCVYYRFMYEDNIILKGSDYENLNSIHYSVWLEQALESYRYVSEALQSVRGARIVGHEMLSDTVSATRYDNGKIIYVNYGAKDYTAANMTVPANGYAVGGAQ